LSSAIASLLFADFFAFAFDFAFAFAMFVPPGEGGMLTHGAVAEHAKF
jgi:hypothetical protein